MGKARPVWALWHGGSSYAPGELPRDLEHFGSIAEARGALRDRATMGGRWPQSFRYVDRPAETALTPCADEGATMTLWTYDPRGEDDPYPSLVLELGPRGGIRRVMT